LNFQEDGQELHYGQLLEVSRHHGVWKELKKNCEFEKRLAEVEAFNKLHRWKKRGVAMIPTKFGISFTTKFLNQVDFPNANLILKTSITIENPPPALD